METLLETTGIAVDLADGLLDRSDAGFDDTQAVERAVRSFQYLKATEADIPALFQPGGEWKDYLLERQTAYDILLTGSFAEQSEVLGNFWRNELSPIVKEYAKYDQLIADSPEFVERFTRNVLRNWVVLQRIYGVSLESLQVGPVGNPWGLTIDGQLVVPKAARYMALTIQIQQLLRATHAVGKGAEGERQVVAEIGAGYGGMADYLLRENNSVTYVDFDLPETLVLASYYLMASHPDKKFYLPGEGKVPITREELAQYDVVLLPNHAIADFAPECASVFLNTFSLSEIPKPVLAKYLECIESMTTGYFLHHNMDRPKVFNRGFERTPASQYPIDDAKFALVATNFDLFHGHQGDYREFLYARV